MPVVIKRSKRYQESAKAVAPQPIVVDQAVDVVKGFKPTKFDQSVEVIFSLGIDASQADQTVRSSLSLPHGIGKSKHVVAFCPDHLAAAATEAGAVRAGGQDLVAAIEKENFTDFDVAVATPDMMRFVGRLGKVLGPRLDAVAQGWNGDAGRGGRGSGIRGGQDRVSQRQGREPAYGGRQVELRQGQAGGQYQRDHRGGSPAQAADQQGRLFSQSDHQGFDDACGSGESRLRIGSKQEVRL